MVEVFKTNVSDLNDAEKILNIIHLNFTHCTANFDLDDCDRILRIASNGTEICTKTIIGFLVENGCLAEVLTD